MKTIDRPHAWIRVAARALGAAALVTTFTAGAAERGTPDAGAAPDVLDAALVAQGKTNREVAAALFVTEHSVENALTRIYRKLDVRSRAELAARSAAP